MKCSEPILEAKTEAPTYGYKSFIRFEPTYWEYIVVSFLSQCNSDAGRDARPTRPEAPSVQSVTYRKPCHKSASQEVSAHCASVRSAHCLTMQNTTLIRAMASLGISIEGAMPHPAIFSAAFIICDWVIATNVTSYMAHFWMTFRQAKGHSIGPKCMTLKPHVRVMRRHCPTLQPCPLWLECIE